MFEKTLAILITATQLGNLLQGQSPPTGDLLVYNAAALGPPFKDLLAAFARRYPDIHPLQENSPSLEAVRKLTDLDKPPDVLAVADYSLLPRLVIPQHASWYVTFGTNAMVLAYTDQSSGANEITTENWWRLLLRPGVRVGRSDPHVDPSGYRALLALQLAERYYRRPGLAGQLLKALPERYVRHAEADLSALVQAGELDYGWTYLSLARAHRLRYVRLPREIDLSDPALAGWYRQVSVRIPNSGSRDSLEFRGEPIVFALTIPTRAPHPEAARAFVAFALASEGREILEQSGFTVLPEPLAGGLAKPPIPPFSTSR